MTAERALDLLPDDEDGVAFALMMLGVTRDHAKDCVLGCPIAEYLLLATGVQYQVGMSEYCSAHGEPTPLPDHVTDFVFEAVFGEWPEIWGAPDAD